HWRQATAVKRIQWVTGSIIFALLVIYYTGEIIHGCQSQWHYAEEHRPKVIFSHEPQFARHPLPDEIEGVMSCNVTDSGAEMHTGTIRIWLKNIGSEDASGVFISPVMATLVPEKKVGDPFVDHPPPTITPETCWQSRIPK